MTGRVLSTVGIVVLLGCTIILSSALHQRRALGIPSPSAKKAGALRITFWCPDKNSIEDKERNAHAKTHDWSGGPVADDYGQDNKDPEDYFTIGLHGDNQLLIGSEITVGRNEEFPVGASSKRSFAVSIPDQQTWRDVRHVNIQLVRGRGHTETTHWCNTRVKIESVDGNTARELVPFQTLYLMSCRPNYASEDNRGQKHGNTISIALGNPVIDLPPPSQPARLVISLNELDCLGTEDEHDDGDEIYLLVAIRDSKGARTDRIPSIKWEQFKRGKRWFQKDGRKDDGDFQSGWHLYEEDFPLDSTIKVYFALIDNDENDIGKIAGMFKNEVVAAGAAAGGQWGAIGGAALVKAIQAASGGDEDDILGACSVTVRNSRKGNSDFGEPSNCHWDFYSGATSEKWQNADRENFISFIKEQSGVGTRAHYNAHVSVCWIPEKGGVSPIKKESFK